MGRNALDPYSYLEGQWDACDKLMNKINSSVGPLRRADFYRMLMEYRPQLRGSKEEIEDMKCLDELGFMPIPTSTTKECADLPDTTGPN